MQSSNTVFLITLCIIALGFLLKKRNIIAEKEGKVVSKLLMHTTFPAMVLLTSMRATLDVHLIFLPLVAIIMGCGMMCVAWIWFRHYPSKIRGLTLMSVGGFNTGLFGYSLVEGIWGQPAMSYIIMYDIGVTAVIFCVAYPIGRYYASHGTGAVQAKEILAKVIRLPPLIAMAIGLTINILSLTLPGIVVDFLDVLAKANRPLVLMLMGIYLHIALDKNQVYALVKALSIRYAFGLVAVLCCYYFLPPSLLQSTLIVCVVLPVGLTLIPFSDELNFDTRLAAALVNVSLILSFVLLWGLVIGLGLG